MHTVTTKPAITRPLALAAAFLALATASLQPLAAQIFTQDAPATPAPAAVWAPFVSQLRLAVKNPYVRLTWLDVDNFNGSYLIYRHSKEITADTIGSAQLAGSVAQGEQYFSDTPETGSWYYAVVAKSETGQVWHMFIPFRNVTLNPVNIQRDDNPAAAFTSISRIQAQVKDKGIEVSFQSSLNHRQVIVYRSAQPIRQRDRTGMVQVYRGSGRNMSFVDAAIPGVAWYYGAADLEADQQGVVTWVAGDNTTATGAEIPIELSSSWVKSGPPARPLPLPALTLPGLNPSGNTLDTVNVPTEKLPLSAETLRLVNKTLSAMRVQPPIKLVPVLLPSDNLVLSRKTVLPYAGESKILVEILQKTFAKQDWPEAIRLYRNTLLLNLSEETNAKVRYYLGQALYFTGKYREALLEFLMAQGQLREYAQTWITSCLVLLDR